jgi:hypothetical protein
MQMVARTYVIRQIEDSDRLDYQGQVENAETRGDRDEVAIIKEAFVRWEREQGHEEEITPGPRLDRECIWTTGRLSMKRRGTLCSGATLG